MITPAASAKKTLRAQMRSQMAARSVQLRAEASAAIRERISTLMIWRNAASILFFAPMADEPDLWPLLTPALAAEKIIALPSFVPDQGGYVARRISHPGRDLIAGQFGVQEAAARCVEIPLNQLDLVLVPGLAFDACGRRLGRGKGFYDRLLADVRGTKCGVAFEEQVVDAVPVEPLDIHLNCILTPTRWIET